MSFNLIDAAKGLLTNELVGKASSFLGESEGGVTKAMNGILPSLVGGLIDKSSTTEGANTIAHLASEAHQGGALDNLGSFFGNDSGSLLSKGSSMLSGLFGSNKVDGITSMVSNFAGLKGGSVTSLLSMAAPMLLGLLGKHAATNNVNASGLASMLSSQKSSIANATPSGFNLSSLFGGISNTAHNVASDVKGAATSTVNYATDTVEKAAGGMKWLLPLLLLVLAVLAAWYLLGKGCGKTSDSTTGTDSTHTSSTVTTSTDTTHKSVTGKLDSLTGDWIYDEGAQVSLALPNGGGELKVGANSTEAKLVHFLSDASQKVDTVKGNWFEFTNVHFNSGKSTITDGSQAQLKNVAAIVKAYSTAQFKLGGYTDSTGTLATNIAVSEGRAKTVQDFLIKNGVKPTSFVGVKGFGPQWPLADNATAEGRAQNRRVAVNVKAK